MTLPSFRFKDLNGNSFPEWVEMSLGEVLDYEQPTSYIVSSSEYESTGNVPVLTAGKSFILGYTNEDFGIFDSNLPVIIFDDFTTASKLVQFPFKVKSSAIKILHVKKGYNIRFVFEAMQMVRYEIGGHQRHWISIFSRIPIFVPSLPEQQKIASFLSAIDNKIELLSRKKSLLEKYKKGVMQKIFSQEIRFKDVNGNDFPEWAARSLGEVLDYEQPTSYIVSSSEYESTGDVPVLTAGKSFILGYTNEDFGIFDSNLPVIIFDDFTTASKLVQFPFKVKSSAIKILHIKKGYNIQFVFEAMQMIRYEIGGHQRHWISIFSSIPIFVPSLPEQQKIADFLSAIDKKIELVSQQIEKTKLYKKGLLQQMFV